jgi:hypothetical protein
LALVKNGPKTLKTVSLFLLASDGNYGTHGQRREKGFEQVDLILLWHYED